MDKTLKDIIANIKCGNIASPVFTQEDLDAIKSCLPDNVEVPAKIISQPVTTDEPSCINDGINELNRIVSEQLAKQSLVIELSTIKGKVQEALDHYSFISGYYKTRVDFYSSVISKMEPFTSQYLYWTDEFNRLLAIEELFRNTQLSSNILTSQEKEIFTKSITLSDTSFYDIKQKNYSNTVFLELFGIDGIILLNASWFKEYYEYRTARIESNLNQLLAKDGSVSSLTASLQSIPQLPSDTNTLQLINSILIRYSGQLIPTFSNSELTSIFGTVTPPRTLSFGVRLIDLDSTTINIPSIDLVGNTTQDIRLINIRNSQYLTNSPFAPTVSTYCLSIPFDKNPNFIANYNYIPGALYNKVDTGYAGYYQKLAHPIKYLYTLDERGLTTDPNLIDPILKATKDVPVSVTDDQLSFYIKSQATYTKFYKTLETTLPDKLKYESDIVFPNEISSIVSAINDIAISEVADFFRKITDLPIKLARPTSYTVNNSSIHSQGTFTYSKLDPSISQMLSYYNLAYTTLLDKINILKSNLNSLDDMITNNSMSETVLTEKISNIACFKKVAVDNTNLTVTNCEAETMQKLGTDPLFIRTLNGTDSTLPDMNTQCYWREFTNAINDISILPFPDIKSPAFRYYPINNIIPTPFGVILIPLPTKWKQLFSLSSPIGTFVTFIVMPIAIVGIPLPSVYVLYLSSDGNKYMIAAPNITLLKSSNAMKYGFEIDNSDDSDNPLGINSSDPFKGHSVKGSLSIPLSVAASVDKSSRLTKIAATLALGEPLTITTRNGSVLDRIDQATYSDKYLSDTEKAADAADAEPTGDFNKQVIEFKRNISKQFDRLGDMQITSITNQKDKIRKERQTEVLLSENESNLKKRRELRNKARSLDSVTLTDKVNSVLSDFSTYIDKIHLGTISYPSDPTRMNPKQSAAVSGTQPINQLASQGSLNKDEDSTNLLAKLKRSASQVDPSTITTKKTFNLSTAAGIQDFTETLRLYSTEVIDNMSGEKSAADNPDPTLSDVEKTKIKESSVLRKKRLKTALAFSALTLIKPNFQLFDSSAPCCIKDRPDFEIEVSPQAAAAIAVFISLFDAFVDGLTPEVLVTLLGESLEDISVSAIGTLYTIILSVFPPITLPSKPDLSDIASEVIAPVLTMVSVPQAVNPLGLPFPVQLTIPLDSLVKPLLIASIAYLLELTMKLLADEPEILSTSNLSTIIKQIPCSNSQTLTVTSVPLSEYITVTLPNGSSVQMPKTSTIPLDIIAYFAILTSSDLQQLVRNLIMTAVDGILDPVKSIITPIISVTNSLKDLSFSSTDLGNPLLLPIKLATMTAQLQIPNSKKIRIANQKAIDLLTAAYIPIVTSTENTLKEVAYLGSISACAFGNKAGVKSARIAASPFFNQDDLPPWERLTHKNPLFAIFLDELVWRSSLLSTGSLMFKTKMPGLYPAAVVPNVINDPGIH